MIYASLIAYIYEIYPILAKTKPPIVMKEKGLILVVVSWIVLTIVNYYFVNFFILAFEWLLLLIILTVITLFQLFKLIKEAKSLTKLRVVKFTTFSILLFLTYKRDSTNLIIEKIDWILLLSKRKSIVYEVKNNKLNPNVKWNGWVCELPFNFPVVSNGGNDIGVYRNKENNGTTITFWVFRNFFDSPSTHFIYTDDQNEIERLENKIKVKPQDNWKLEKNWYRTYEEQ